MNIILKEINIINIQINEDLVNWDIDDIYTF